MPRLRRSLLFFSLSFVLLWSTASAASPPKPKPARKYSAPRVTGKIMQPSPFPGPGGPPILNLDGDWQLVDVPAGTAFSSDDGTGGQVQGQSITATSETDQHVYVLHGDAGVSSSPLSDSIKQDLLPAQDPYGGGVIGLEEGEDSVYIVSQETAEGIDASEAAGELTPEIAAIAEPLDDGGDGDIDASSYGPSPTSIFGGSCSPKPQSYSRTINLADKTYSKDLPLSGGFSGSISLTGHITGTVNGDARFRRQAQERARFLRAVRREIQDASRLWQRDVQRRYRPHRDGQLLGHLRTVGHRQAHPGRILGFRVRGPGEDRLQPAHHQRPQLERHRHRDPQLQRDPRRHRQLRLHLHAERLHRHPHLRQQPGQQQPGDHRRLERPHQAGRLPGRVRPRLHL